jgi:hypothetical protein
MNPFVLVLALYPIYLLVSGKLTDYVGFAKTDPKAAATNGKS